MTNMKLLIFTSALFLTAMLALLAACSGRLKPEQAEQALATMLQKTVRRDGTVRNAVLLVDAPGLGIEGAWAAGIAAEDGSAAMTVDTPFLSASVGKLFTAALVVSLAEEGVLSLEDSVVDRLDPALVAGLPVAGGGAALREITVRRLLAQRTGLPDYYEGRTADGAPNLFELISETPQRSWTPLAVLEYTKRHYAPAGAPGEVFLYADTNYDLLGFIAEAAGRQAFHEIMEERILRPLNLQNTWMHAKSPAPYADVWFGDYNAAGTPATTLDWAGGGLATTVGDLRTFLRSLLAGRPVGLAAFQAEWTENAVARGIDYGYGLWRIRPGALFFMLKGYPELLGVSGSTGSFLYWVPAYDAVIAGSFNQTGYREKHVAFLIKVLRVLKKAAAWEAA